MQSSVFGFKNVPNEGTKGPSELKKMKDEKTLYPSYAMWTEDASAIATVQIGFYWK